jgi:hypothetical protein
MISSLAVRFPVYEYVLWEVGAKLGGPYPILELGEIRSIRQSKIYRLFNALLPVYWYHLSY